MTAAGTPDADDLFDRALTDHEAGRLARAASGYRNSLVHDPDHAESLHLLGLITAQTGDADAGATLIGRAIALSPGRAPHHNSLAMAYRLLGRLEDAVREYRTALDLRPHSAEINNNLAATLRDLGRRDEAIAHYQRAAEQGPGVAEIWYNLASTLAGQGPLEETEACFRRAIALNPQFVNALSNYGSWLTAQGRWVEGEAWLAEAVRLAPGDVPTWNNLGIARQSLGRAGPAEESYRRAIVLDPRFADAHYNLGCLLHGDGRTDEAIASHAAAIAADGRHGAARLALCTAQLPILYRTTTEIAERRARYRAALTDLAAAVEDPSIAHAVAAAIGTSQPFFLPYQGEDDLDLQTLYGGLACRLLASQPPPPEAGERIRLGIVSGFFHDHTIFKLFLEGWLTEIDRTRFAVTGFHTGRTSDASTARAAMLCDRFVRDPPDSGWRDAVLQAAPQILLYPEIGIDPIAGRLAAQRLAPVQCVAWGHPETTGMPTLDYFLSADLMEPPDAAAHYSERLVRLPRLGLCYFPDSATPPPADRASLNLPRDQPVYWSGQALFKYLPQYDAIFPRIAAAVGPCRFIFIGFAKSEAVTLAFRQRLAHAFAGFGLDANQYCVLLPPMPQERFIAAVGAADVILDTPGWSGGKSTLDCLAQNTPVVTCPGAFMRGRHTAAILRRIGCGDTIATSLDEYVTIAARLGSDPAWRARQRRAIATGKHRAYRDTGYIRALETFLADALTRPAGGPR